MVEFSEMSREDLEMLTEFYGVIDHDYASKEEEFENAGEKRKAKNIFYLQKRWEALQEENKK